MSTENEEKLRNRLRAELDRLGLSMAEAARMIGEDDSLGLRDVCNGRKRATAELIGRLAVTGVDVYYVLTDQRVGAATTLTARESALVENYRASPEKAKKALETTSAALAQYDVKKAKTG